MSPLLVMDDVCIVGTGLAVLPWRSSQNENSLVAKEKEDKVLCKFDKGNAILTASPLGPIIPG